MEVYMTFQNVSFCHTHETFLYITLHTYTNNNPKSPHNMQYLCVFCIIPPVLTFVMKHMTCQLFSPINQCFVYSFIRFTVYPG